MVNPAQCYVEQNPDCRGNNDSGIDLPDIEGNLAIVDEKTKSLFRTKELGYTSCS
jgi:hypothetical protein